MLDGGWLSGAMTTTTILSIDGGGIRGIIPALVLEFIEEQAGQPIASLFDVIAGTSTGGIIALGLSCPDDSGAARYRAADLANMYDEQGARIFPHELLGKVRQVFEPKYSSRGRLEVLDEKLGSTPLSGAITEVLVTSYDIWGRAPVFFRSSLASEDPERDHLMRDVAAATSAAPTYFEPVRLQSPGSGPEYVLVDGGVFANNPGMCALVDRTTVGGHVENAFMVSLGTGTLTRHFSYRQARRWGLLGWAQRVLDVTFDGVSEATDYQLQTILGDRYHRFEIPLEHASDNMDDAEPQNLANLRRKAEELISTKRPELESVCSALRALRRPPATGTEEA